MKQYGFTLIELMVSIAVLGVLVGVAINSYNSHMKSVQMTMLASRFDDAVRTAKTEYLKNRATVSIGLASTLPTDDAGWITVFSPMNGTGSHHTFVAGLVVLPQSRTIGVELSAGGTVLTLVRSEYLPLEALTTTINSSGEVTYL